MNKVYYCILFLFLVLFDIKVIELFFIGFRFDWDSDIVAVLDDDFDYNDLEN